MKAVIRVAFFLLFCSVIKPQGTLAQTETKETTKPYRIAAIIPLSGQVASMGIYLRRGFELALAELPQAERNQISVTFEDDAFDPRQTVTAYRKLMSDPGVDAVFVMASPPANALVPITERDGKILVGVGASDPSIAVGKNLSFVHWVTPPVLAKSLVEGLKSGNYQRIAFLTSEASGTVADVNAVIETLSAQNMAERVVFHEIFPKEETDFRTRISKLKLLQPDAVVLLLFPGSLSSFAKQYRAAGLQAEIIGMESFEDEGEVKAAAGTLDGTWYVNAASPAEAFVTSYRARFNEHPGWAAANAYDTLRLVAHAVHESGRNNEKVRDYLRSLKDYSGACGVYSASGDNRFTLPAEPKRITDRGFVPISLDQLTKR